MPQGNKHEETYVTGSDMTGVQQAGIDPRVIDYIDAAIEDEAKKRRLANKAMQTELANTNNKFSALDTLRNMSTR